MVDILRGFKSELIQYYFLQFKIPNWALTQVWRWKNQGSSEFYFAVDGLVWL